MASQLAIIRALRGSNPVPRKEVSNDSLIRLGGKLVSVCLKLSSLHLTFQAILEDYTTFLGCYERPNFLRSWISFCTKFRVNWKIRLLEYKPSKKKATSQWSNNYPSVT